MSRHIARCENCGDETEIVGNSFCRRCYNKNYHEMTEQATLARAVREQKSHHEITASIARMQRDTAKLHRARPYNENVAKLIDLLQAVLVEHTGEGGTVEFEK